MQDTRKSIGPLYNRKNIRRNISHLYGEEMNQHTRNLEKLRSKKSRLLCDLAFLRRCRDQNITPTCCRLSFHTKTSKMQQILDRTSKTLLRELIHNTRKNLSFMDTQLYALHLRLSTEIHPTLWTKIDTLAHFRAENDAEIRTQWQKDKINRLHAKSTHKEAAGSLQNVVHNLSHKTLSEPAQTALAKGFNFAIAPARIPVESIVCGIEADIQELDSDTSETICQDVTAIL